MKLRDLLPRLRIAWRTFRSPTILLTARELDQRDTARARREMQQAECLAVGKITGSLPSTIADRNEAIIDAATLLMAQLNELVERPDWRTRSPESVAAEIRGLVRTASSRLLALGIESP